MGVVDSGEVLAPLHVLPAAPLPDKMRPSATGAWWPLAGWIVLTESLVAGCRVLVADDSPFALELIKAILDKAGCTNLTGAGGGREALARAGEIQFDVVLLDVTMPDMNGYEVTRQLRAAHTPGPVIVMLSGRDIVEVDLAAREAGADGVMAKPVDRRKLLELLETLLQQRRALAV